jgi:uncharacterized phage-associated protein
MTAVDVLDVAKYILEYQDKPLTTMKLQKLAYYAQAWHATWADSDRLIKQEFQAWVNGPVCYELFDQHRGRLVIDKGSFEVGCSDLLSEGQKASINQVLEAYAPLSGSQLSTLTHSEEPWIHARAGLEEGTGSSNPIPLDVMVTYYRKILESGVLVSECEWLNR